MPSPSKSSHIGAFHRANVYLLSLLFGLSILFFQLGQWQLRRHQEKLEHKHLLQTRQLLPRGDASLLLTLQQSYQRKIQLSGKWLDDYSLLLDNVLLHQQPGYLVYTPLLLASQHIIWVQRGWIPAGQARASITPPAPSQKHALLQIDGTLTPKAPQSLQLHTPFSSPPPSSFNNKIVTTLADASLPNGFQDKVIPAILIAEHLDSPALQPYPLQLNASQAEKHFGYALQWFGLSLAAIFYIVYFYWRDRKKRTST